MEPSEIGRVFAVVGLGQAIVPLISNPLFGLVYKATLDSFPGAYLLIVAGMLIFVLGSSTFMSYNQFLQKRRAREHTENAENNEDQGILVPATTEPQSQK